MNVQQEISSRVDYMDDDLRQMRNIVMWAALIAIGAAFLFGACHWINDKFHISDDNLVEEVVEAQLQSQLGVDIDLTPETPER